MFIRDSKFVCILAVLLMIPMLARADVEVRNITPPKLDSAHLGREILCHRPMRRGMPNMSVEKKEGKVIAHNYGHGGSGWTLGPGSAAYVNDLLLKSEYAAGLTDSRTHGLTDSRTQARNAHNNHWGRRVGVIYRL